MVRKQIYLEEGQDAMVKRLARARGVSEAAIIREAIDRQAVQKRLEAPPPDPAAWARVRQFVLGLQAQGPIHDRPRRWKREDAYKDRLSRYARRSR